MYAIIHSTWINELRARSVRKRASFEWDDDFLENLPDPVDRSPETQLMHGQIVDAIERLPEAQRVVMLLVAVEGFVSAGRGHAGDSHRHGDEPPLARPAVDRRHVRRADAQGSPAPTHKDSFA